MEKFNYKSLEKELNIELSDSLVKEIEEYMENILIKVEKIKKLNLENVCPIHYLDDTPTTYLREDKIDHESQKEKILDNATNKDSNYILIDRVVK
ncbi:MAG: aspartyl/glutamyl-tRNA amidotransferase subunit C [Mycoplasma sp.]|nr:aspartyl/glutamyl-tRNA amidotransferase subunit C [Mycoplasma sp.]